MFEALAKDDLVRIAAEGGGFRTDGSARPVIDLVHIAAAAGRSGARLILTGCDGLSVDELAQIAIAGRGNVMFDDREAAK